MFNPHRFQTQLGVGILIALGFVVFSGAEKPKQTPAPIVKQAAQPKVDVSELEFNTPVVKPKVVEEKKPAAKGHFEKRYVEGAYRWVWFTDTAQKAAVSRPSYSGNCANGQCYAPARRGLFRRR